MKIAQLYPSMRPILVMMLVVTSICAYAQREEPQPSVTDSVQYEVPAAPLFAIPAPAYGLMPMHTPFSLMPGAYSGFWPIHQGLNVQVGMEVSVGLGKYAPKGVGFGQYAGAVFAQPLGNRFVLAAGIFAANMDWGRYHRTDGGVGALLAYRLNDRISLFAYGIKSFAPRREYSTLADRHFFPNFGDRIGVGADFKIGEAASITVAFEHRSGPDAYFGPIALPPMKPYGQE